MKYLNGEYYVEVKDHRNEIHPTENIILRKQDPPTFSELNIRFKTRLRYGEIRKSSKMITIS